MEAQPTPVGLRSKPSNLIDSRIVFRSRPEKYISAEPLFSPSNKGKSQACEPGRSPFHSCPGECVSHPPDAERQCPLSGEVDLHAAVERQNPGRPIPIPMLSVRELHGPHPIVFADFPRPI